MSIAGSSSIRRLKDCPVVVGLHELTPHAGVDGNPAAEPKRCRKETAPSLGRAAVGVLASLVTPAAAHRSRSPLEMKIYVRVSAHHNQS